MVNHIVEEGLGLSNSIAYTHYTEILAYAMSRYGFEWFYQDDECVLTRDEVNRAAVSASDKIDTLRWNGRRSKSKQNMEWPRCGAYSCCNEGYCVPSHIIPKEIKDATIILTLMILKGEVQVGTNRKNAKVKSVKFDKMSIQFAEGAYIDSTGGSCGGGLATTSGDEFESVRHLINCYLSTSGKVNASFVKVL